MAVIYLKHAVHGRKVAVMELEALADEKLGWVRYTPMQSVAGTVQPIASELLVQSYAPEVKSSSAGDDFLNNLGIRNPRGRPRKDAN